MSEQARQDLRDKLILEKNLLRKINSLNRRIVRDTTRKFAATGEVANADDYREDIADMLNDHYGQVARKFDNRLRGDLPSEISITEEEDSRISEALAIFFLARSNEQAGIITETNRRDIGEATSDGVSMAQDEAINTGIQLSGPEVATLIGVSLRRKLVGRAGAIALYETQTSAEASKATEAEVLSGQDPSVLTGSQKKSDVTKQWVTVGDEKVREAHMKADSQLRDLNLPYNVGGELLRWPGDTSLGATAGNVINCRCSSIVDTGTVISSRRERLAPAPKPKPEPEPIEPIKPKPPKPPASPSVDVTPKPTPTPIKDPLKVDDFKEPPSTPVRVKPDGKLPKDITKIKKKLTDNQKIQIKDYTEDGYKETNSFMRNSNKFSESTQKEFRAQIKSINGAISKSELTENVTLYRGTNSNKINSAVLKMKAGSKIPISQFQSTSTSRSSALEFTSGKEKPVLFRINAKKGMNALDLDQFKIESLRGEREILLSNRGEYTVKSVKKETGLFGEEITVIDLDYGLPESIKNIVYRKIDDPIEEIEISVSAIQRMYFSEQEMFYSLIKSTEYEILITFLDT